MKCPWCGKRSTAGAQAMRICSECKRHMDVGGGGMNQEPLTVTGSGGSDRPLCGKCHSQLFHIKDQGKTVWWCKVCKIGSGGGYTSEKGNADFIVVGGDGSKITSRVVSLSELTDRIETLEYRMMGLAHKLDEMMGLAHKLNEMERRLNKRG